MKTIVMLTALAFATTGIAAQAQDAAPAAPALPTCSKTVTDKCVNRTVHHRKVIKKTTKITKTHKQG
ncbi:hypothetical protein [Sphingomonas montanisoli]|uniref:Uncharacterized protein n=1 Tax=Sphingomonas montanisoli TaxID=2606412 RepID=A0A5D9CAB4_9SPHN|nr:hypothetical protein [Sphingomonas montanisoli]TZG28639.1 hypothetical protein FYJ91_00345 [Sphingomonas montanisoli]